MNDGRPTPTSARRALAFALLALAAGAPGAHAQSGRLFLSVPYDSNLAILTYNGVRSNTWLDEALVVPTSESRSQTESLVYSRIMNVFGRTGGPGISIPYSSLLSYDKTTGLVQQDASAVADPALTFDVNLFGAPALDAEQFKTFVPRTYCGIHLTLGTPWGSYDPVSATNIGGNRWTYKALLNYSITWDQGASWVDFYPSVRFFGDNDEYQRDRTLSQSPIYGLEAHYSRTVAKRTWLSGGLIGSAGGRVEVDGQPPGDAQQALKLALGAGFPTWPGGTGILAYSHTVARSEGSPRADTFMIQLIHKF
ncbi:MAG TPA: transporter [Thermoleophilaceae bacterium]|nr:transporter [Thermoleophilaceae bacterium]